MSPVAPATARSGGSLPLELRYLRVAALWRARGSALMDWGRQHLNLTAEAERAWLRRAWWGLAAGEAVRRALYDAARWPHVWSLVDAPDWSEVDEARRRHGGIIIAGAHIGPPKVAMNWLLARNLPLMVWTNTRDMPGWLEPAFRAGLLNPLDEALRPALLVRAALHIRDGGVLFGAPDWPSGKSTISFERLGCSWSFSQGIPALARTLGAPTFLLMALWSGQRIRMVCERLPEPEATSDDEAWHRAWLASYWERIERIIHTSPENLRFLRHVNNGAIRAELDL